MASGLTSLVLIGAGLVLGLIHLLGRRSAAAGGVG